MHLFCIFIDSGATNLMSHSIILHSTSNAFHLRFHRFWGYKLDMTLHSTGNAPLFAFSEVINLMSHSLLLHSTGNTFPLHVHRFGGYQLGVTLHSTGNARLLHFHSFRCFQLNIAFTNRLSTWCHTSILLVIHFLCVFIDSVVTNLM